MAQCLVLAKHAQQNTVSNQLEEKCIENKYFTDICDFHRLVRVEEQEDRAVRYMVKQGPQKKTKKLRELLDIGEKVLLIAERLKKKDAPGVCIRALPITNHFSAEMKFVK